jgi:hypothetical protein
MDILAPIFAYLTCVAGIVGAFVVSFVVVFSTPEQPALPQHGAAMVSASPLKTAALAEAGKPAAKDGPADKLAVNYVSNTQKREAAPQAAAAPTASQKLAAIDARQKTKISRAQWRQIVGQERSKRLAYQQGADYETRFLGYAD